MALNDDSLEAVAQEAALTVIRNNQHVLRTVARSAEWPAPIVASLKLRYDNGEIQVAYPEESSEEINNLEYGDINSLPKPVFRPLSRTVDNDVKVVLQTDVMGQLFKVLGVI